MNKSFTTTLGLTRIAMGLIFLWAFFDKLFGLGFATSPEKAWLAGISPTSGFLQNSTEGPFGRIFQSLAGSAVVDWLFMLGLLLIGIALVFGIAMRLASYAGALLMSLMWLATLLPEHHPFLDEHIIYALVLLLCAFGNAGTYLGLTKFWHQTKLVQKIPILK